MLYTNENNLTSKANNVLSQIKYATRSYYLLNTFTTIALTPFIRDLLPLHKSVIGEEKCLARPPWLNVTLTYYSGEVNKGFACFEVAAYRIILDEYFLSVNFTEADHTP